MGTKIFYEVPLNSSDLYLRAEHFEEIYGPNFFFVTGHANPPAALSEKFSPVHRLDFFLGDAVAYNPTPSDPSDSAQQAARDFFETNRKQYKQLFLSYRDVREKKAEDKRLQLLSGGGFMFVHYAFDDSPEMRLALFRRTDGQNVLTDANGLATGRYTAERKMLEEYTPVATLKDGSATVLAVRMENWGDGASDQCLLAAKRRQEPEILSNLLKVGTHPNKLIFALAPLEPLSTDTNVIVLRDKDWNVIDHLEGAIGYEHDNNTWVYRKAGILKVPYFFHPLLLVDGEGFAREGRYYRREDFYASIEAKDILSSTGSIGMEYVKNWPRPIWGRGTPSFFRPGI